MATAIAARHVYKHRGTGLTGHCRPACAAGRPRRRQRPADLEPCSTPVFDGLPAQTIASSSTLKRVESWCQQTGGLSQTGAAQERDHNDSRSDRRGERIREREREGGGEGVLVARELAWDW